MSPVDNGVWVIGQKRHRCECSAWPSLTSTHSSGYVAEKPNASEPLKNTRLYRYFLSSIWEIGIKALSFTGKSTAKTNGMIN
jgi:hypothetical protein